MHTVIQPSSCRAMFCGGCAKRHSPSGRLQAPRTNSRHTFRGGDRGEWVRMSERSSWRRHGSVAAFSMVFASFQNSRILRTWSRMRSGCCSYCCFRRRCRRHRRCCCFVGYSVFFCFICLFFWQDKCFRTKIKQQPQKAHQKRDQEKIKNHKLQFSGVG